MGRLSVMARVRLRVPMGPVRFPTDAWARKFQQEPPPTLSAIGFPHSKSLPCGWVSAPAWSAIPITQPLPFTDPIKSTAATQRRAGISFLSRAPGCVVRALYGSANALSGLRPSTRAAWRAPLGGQRNKNLTPIMISNKHLTAADLV